LFDPPVIPSLDGLIRAETVFRQVAQARTRARQPENGIEETAGIAARSLFALSPARNKLTKTFPLNISKNFTFHTDLQKSVLNLI